MSPVPLGFWAAAGAGASGGGIGTPAYDLISSTTGAGSTIVTFSSIPNTYKHLELRYQIRESANSVNTLLLRFNSISTSSYSHQRVYADGTTNFNASTISAARVASTTSINLGPDGGIGQFDICTGIITVNNYSSTSVAKTVASLQGKAGADKSVASIYYGSGGFNSTSAIDTLTILTSAGNFGSNSRFYLYGIRG